MNQLTIGFIGLGLIGGSIAKTVRRVAPDNKIIAYNRSEDARHAALADGVADFVTGKIDENFSSCDYIFLCAPVEYNIEYLKILKNIIKSTCIITDVGSVKTNIHNAAAELGLEKNFIGGHPMAGSEKTGYGNATDRLIENAYYAITPTALSKQEDVDNLVSFVKSIGAIPIVLNYEEHDNAVAAISHLPHLIASSLVNLVKDSDSENETMKILAAGGFKDITRIASSSPVMWEQICMTNNVNISKLLQSYIDDLNEVKNNLDTLNGQAISDMFEKSREYRNSMSDRSSGLISKSHIVYCDIIDEAGAISTIATILASNSISIKNIGIVHNREFEEGVLKIELENDNSLEKSVALLKKYRYTVHRR